MLARHDVLRQPTSQRLQLAFQAAAVYELEQIQAGVVGEPKHRSKRRLIPLGVKAIDAARLAGCSSKHSRKRLAKTAGRFESLIELQIEHALSFPDSAEREPHAARAMIGMKAHAAIALKCPARGRWVDAHALQIRLAQPSAGLGFDSRQQFLHNR